MTSSGTVWEGPPMSRRIAPIYFVSFKRDSLPSAEEAALALLRIGGSAVNSLIDALNDENRYVRRSAAKALKRSDAPEAIAALEERQS